MLLSKCVVLKSKNSRSTKEHKANGLFNSLGLKILLYKIPLLGDNLFQGY